MGYNQIEPRVNRQQIQETYKNNNAHLMLRINGIKATAMEEKINYVKAV